MLQRFYRSTHGERKDSEGLMQEIVKKMSKAKVFLTEINQVTLTASLERVI